MAHLTGEYKVGFYGLVFFLCDLTANQVTGFYTRATPAFNGLSHVVFGARQRFQLFRQNNWLLENNNILPKFFMGFCIT